MMGKTHKERLEIELGNIIQLGESALARLNLSNAHPSFSLDSFNRMAKKLQEEIYPRMESLLSEIEDLKNEAEDLKHEAQTDRTTAATERAATISERAAATSERAAVAAEIASAQAQLESMLKLADKLEKAPLPTTEQDFQLAAQAILADDAIKAKEEAFVQRNDALQQLQDLRAISTNDLAQKQAEVDKLQSEVMANQAIATKLQDDLSVAQEKVTEMRRKLGAQDSGSVSSRRTAFEAGLSSPEPGERINLKRPSISAVSGIPLPSKPSKMPKSSSLGSLTTESRAGVSTRKSGSRTSLSTVDLEEEPQVGKGKKPRHDIEASYSLLVLPADWDDAKRATFKQQYSAIKGNDLIVQEELLSKSSNETCLISSFEKQRSKLGNNIPIDYRSQCPTCSKKGKEEKICVHLENIADPDEETRRYLVKERPSKK
jgi:hypothetical protein